MTKENKNIENDLEDIANNDAVNDEQTAEDLLAIEKDKFLRLFAEFENYKKRTSKERIELFRTANQELMTALLPVLDDLSRGIVEVKKVKDKNLLKGMELISHKLTSILNHKGLEKIKVKQGDIFDADIHEAITQIPAPSKKMVDKIIDITEVGYKLGDKIIRFPKVVVGK
jgi:molecular chaperone GrpE